MPAPVLNYPVYTLDNRLLIPADTVLSEEVLESAIFSHGTGSYKTNSLLMHGSVRKDIHALLSRPPYQCIFADQRQLADIMNLMENVYLSSPILQSLDFFRENDFYTYCHILNVFALTTTLAEQLIEDYHDLIQEAAAGPSHDIGKISVPVHILRKSVPLTPTELSMVQHHAPAGYVLLSYYLQDTRNLAARVARDHHERKDGSGYPVGIHLTDRLVEIIAACDVYDALMSSRPYRPVPYDNRTALEEITGMAEKGKLSWEVVQVLVAYNRKDRPHYSECKVSRVKRGAPPLGNMYGVTADEKNQVAD